MSLTKPSFAKVLSIRVLCAIAAVAAWACAEPQLRSASDTAASADHDSAAAVIGNVFTCQKASDSGCSGKLAVFLAGSLTPIAVESTVFVPPSAWLPEGQFAVEFSLRNVAKPPGGVVVPTAVTVVPLAAGKVADPLLCQAAGGTPCAHAAWKTLMPPDWPPDSADAATEQTIRLTGGLDPTSAGFRLCILAQGDPSLAKQGLCFVLRPAGAPNLTLEPASLVFDGGLWHQDQSRGLQVHNAGHATVRILKVEAHMPPNYAVVIGATTLAGGATLTDAILPVAGGKTQVWKVTRLAGPVLPGKHWLHLWTDDPQWPAGRSVPVVMQAQPACLSFAAKSLTLTALPGQKASQTVQLRNECGLPLAVTEVAVQAGTPLPAPFAVDWVASTKKAPAVPNSAPSAEQPWTLSPGESAPLLVVYTGTAHPQAKATLLANAGADTAGVQLIGESAAPTGCPKAVPQVTEPDVVIPQTVLHLDGSASVASGAAKIAKYQWTVQQPAGSVQVFLPGPEVAKPTFAANVVGSYEFCLKVWDTAGVASCTASCKSVTVAPEVALHIELVWQTPTDPDESDSGPASGTDLDLHFAHPSAQAVLDLDCDGAPDPWFDNPMDTFWFNAAPAWGDPNNKDDDPTLDLDDTDGGGPENLNLVAPQGTLDKPVAYSVAVHYWNDHGYGTAYATVSVFAQGALATKLAKVKLQPLDLWTVGKVHWPMGNGAAGKKFFEVCRQAGDSCKAGKNLMWQSTGDLCMTRCYVNKIFNGSVGGAATQCKKL